MTSTTKAAGFFSEEQQEVFEAGAPEPAKFRWLERAEMKALGQKAGAWLEANSGLIESLQTGTYVLIEVETGGHVCSCDLDKARAEFDRRFGASTFAFLHRVRMPTTVGGGWWALHSGA